MSTVKNKVNIKQDNETIRSLTQKVSMDGELGNNNGTLIQFIGKFPLENEEKGSFNEKSIFSLVKEGDEIKVKIEMPNLFKDKTGSLLSDNSEITNDLDSLILNIGKDSDNLNRPITFTEKQGGLVAKIKSKDGQEYTITASPTSITIDYGANSYSYSTENESCIDVNMTNDIAKGIFSENSEYSNYFKTPESLKNIPSHILGLYVANLRGTNHIQLDNYNIFSFDALDKNSEQPDIFISQPDDKLYFFNEGKLYRCQEYFFQYNQGTKEYALIVGTTYNHYFKFNVEPNEIDGQLTLSDNFNQLINFLDKNNVPYNSKNDETTKDKIEIHCNDDEKVLKFLPEDKRDYSKKNFKIKPDVINFNMLGKNPPNIPDELVKINKFNEDFIKFYNKYKDYQPSLRGIYKEIISIQEKYNLATSAIEGMTLTEDDINNAITDFSNQIEDIYQIFEEFFSQHQNEDDAVNLHNEITELYDIYKDKENDDKNNNKNNDQPSSDDKQKQSDNLDKEQTDNEKKEDEEDEQEEQEAKKEKKTIDLKKPVENVSNVSMILGVFFMLGAMIPGVGPILATIGAVMTGLGAAGVVYADKFVWDPYEKAKRELDNEDIQTLEDDFFENEKELDILHEKTAEKFAELDKLIESDYENGGNLVAKEFADLYNKYGVGFPEVNDEGKNRFEQLKSMEGFAIRRGIYDLEGQEIIHDGILSQLKEINIIPNPEERNIAINTFINDNFKDVAPEDLDRFYNLFETKNQNYLNEFIDVFSKAHSAQNDERKLYIDQQRYLGGDDEEISSDRISRLVAYPNLTPEDRKKFFERYGEAVLKYYSVQNNASYQQINRLIDRIPENERKDILAILDKKHQQIDQATQSIKEIAKENVLKTNNLKDLEQYALSLNALNDLTQTENYNIMNENEYIEKVNNYLKEYTLAHYNNNPYISQMQQMRKGVASLDHLDENTKKINQAMIETAKNLFVEPKKPNSKHPTPLYKAALNFYNSCKNFGLDKEVAKLYRINSGINSEKIENGEELLNLSSILPSPESTKTNFDCTIQKVATRLANETITEFKNHYTVSKDSIIDKEGNTVNDSTEPLKSYYKKYQQAKDVVKSSETLTKLQATTIEKGQMKSLSDIAKAVAEADNGLTTEMLNDVNNPYNDKYNKLIQDLRKQAPSKKDQVETLAEIKIHLERLRTKSLKYNNKRNKEHNPVIFSEYNAVYNNVETFMDAYINGKLNAIDIANAHNYAMGHADYTYSKDNLKNSGDFILEEMTKEININKLIEKFSSIKDQNTLKDFIQIGINNSENKKESSKLLAEIITKTFSERTLEKNSPTFEQYRQDFIDSEKEGQPLLSDKLNDDINNRISSMEARSQKELSVFEDLLRKCRDNWGREFISRQYKNGKDNVNEENNPLIEYNSPLDILEKRFGVDRQKLIKKIESAQQKDPKMPGNSFINDMLGKFGLNKELYDKEIKSLPIEKQMFNFVDSLSDDDKSKIEILKQTKIKDEFVKKTETFNSFWSNVKEGKGYQDFITFIKYGNDEYVKQLNIYSKIFEITNLLEDSTINENEKIEKIKNYDFAFDITNSGNILQRNAEIKLKQTTLENMAKESNDISIAEQEGDIERFDIISENFSRLWTNLKQQPNNEYIYSAFTTFCNKNKDFIRNLNLKSNLKQDIESIVNNKSISLEDKISKFEKYEENFEVLNSISKVKNYKQYQIDLLKAKNKNERKLLTAKYNLNLTKESANKFNQLWDNVKTNLNEESIDKFVDYINSNPEFIGKLNLQKSSPENFNYEIIYLLKEIKNSEDSPEIKRKRLLDYEKQFKINTMADNQVKKEEKELEELDIKAQTQTEEEFDLFDNQYRLEEFDALHKSLSKNLSAILNLDRDVYSDTDINIALTSFLNGDYTTLGKFNINYEDIEFVNYQSIIKKLEELGNVDTLKYKNISTKPILETIDEMKKQIKKSIKQIKKLFEKLLTPQIDYTKTINEINKHLQSLRNNIYKAQREAKKAFGKKIKTSTNLTDAQLLDNLSINAGMIKSRKEKEDKKQKQSERDLEKEYEQEKQEENNLEDENTEEKE